MPCSTTRSALVLMAASRRWPLVVGSAAVLIAVSASSNDANRRSSLHGASMMSVLRTVSVIVKRHIDLSFAERTVFCPRLFPR